MSQDSVRSAVYRSLVKTMPFGLRDGNGTLEEAKAMTRSSRATPVVPMEHLLRAPAGRRSRDLDCHEDCSQLQLLQVSREAQRLTQMIDSWSKGPNLDGRSRGVAEGLLKGALDLQESLVVLGRLQDGSEYVVRRKAGEAAGRLSLDGHISRLQEPRASVDGGSMDCVDELRRVIRDSFDRRRSLLPRSLEDGSGSSNLSMRFEQEIGSRAMRDSWREGEMPVASVLSVEQPKKAKSPNLIAKLMGLDEVPAEANPTSGREEEKKLLSSKPPLRMPVFDIEMPKVRKQRLVEESSDSSKRTLQDIIENMRFKGVLKNGQGQGSPLVSIASPPERWGAQSPHSNEEVPPIVIMKPLKSPSHLERIAVLEETKTVELIREEMVFDRDEALPESSGREEVMIVRKTKEEFAQKKIEASHSSHKEQKKVALKSRRKIDDGQKLPSTNAKKLEGKKDLKAIKAAFSRSKTEEKPSTMLSKPEQKQLPTNSNMSVQKMEKKCNLNNPLKHRKEKSAASAIGKKTAGEKPAKTFTITKAAKDSRKCKEDGKATKPLCETDTTSTSSSTIPSNGENKNVEISSKPFHKDEKIEEQKIFCDKLLKSISEEAMHLPATKPTIRDDLKCILLSSQAFLLHAQELLTPNGKQPIYRKKSINPAKTKEAALFQDFAKELLARKCHQKELSSHPMFKAFFRGSSMYHTMDQLVQEIGNEFEKLSTYSMVDSDASSEDNLHVRLENDLNGRDMLVNSMWDVGWLNWVCIEEAEKIVGRLGEDILDWLVEEVALESLC